MKIGMLWFDENSKAELPSRIERAASYYHQKYGQGPNLCYVHPSMLKEGILTLDLDEKNQQSGLPHFKVEVRPTKTIRPNHFWLGIKENAASGD